MTYRDVLIKHYKIAERKKQQVEKLAALRDGIEKDANMALLGGGLSMLPWALSLLAPIAAGGINASIPTKRNDVMLKALGGADTLKNMVAGGGGNKALQAAGDRLLNSHWAANMLPWNWGKARAKRQLQTLQKQDTGGQALTSYLRGLIAPGARGMAESMGLDPDKNLSSAVGNLIDTPGKVKPQFDHNVVNAIKSMTTTTRDPWGRSINQMTPEAIEMLRKYITQFTSTR